MELHFTGVIIAVITFLIIGLCHPLVIKMEYYTGTKYWWTFLVVGLIDVRCYRCFPVVGHWRTLLSEKTCQERMVPHESQACTRICGHS